MQCNNNKNILTITFNQRTMNLSYGKHSPLASGKTPYPINAELLFKLFDSHSMNVLTRSIRSTDKAFFCETKTTESGRRRLSKEELEELSQMQKVYNFPELKVFPNMGEMSYLDFKFLVLNDYISFQPDRDFESHICEALDRNDLLVLQKAHDKGIRLKQSTKTFPPGVYNFKSLEVLKWLESNNLLYTNVTFLMETCSVNNLNDCLKYLSEQGYFLRDSEQGNN